MLYERTRTSSHSNQWQAGSRISAYRAVSLMVISWTTKNSISCSDLMVSFCSVWFDTMLVHEQYRLFSGNGLPRNSWSWTMPYSAVQLISRPGPAGFSPLELGWFMQPFELLMPKLPPPEMTPAEGLPMLPVISMRVKMAS